MYVKVIYKLIPCLSAYIQFVCVCVYLRASFLSYSLSLHLKNLSASASSSEINHRLVQLPIPQTWFNQKDVITKHLEWTTNNVHGLSWNNGCAHLAFKDVGNKKRELLLPYQDLSTNNLVYVKGLQKKNGLLN